LAEACKEEGIRLGFYYSQLLDWHHPDGMGNDWDYDLNEKEFSRYFEEYEKLQVLTNYGPVAVIWFDIWTPTPEQARALKELVRKLQPNTIISGRIDPQVAGKKASVTIEKEGITKYLLKWLRMIGRLLRLLMLLGGSKDMIRTGNQLES
jgi:alpha-L-fucosidase